MKLVKKYPGHISAKYIFRNHIFHKDDYLLPTICITEMCLMFVFLLLYSHFCIKSNIFNDLIKLIKKSIKCCIINATVVYKHLNSINSMLP